MAQGLLGFQYEEEKKVSGMTALGGLPLYVELAHAAGLGQSIQRHIRVQGSQGWTDSQVVLPLVMLNLAGGEAVDDLGILEKDAGFCAVLRKAETYGLTRQERRAQQRRWRKERQRTVPSPSVVFRYLGAFHNAGEEERRKAEEAPKAFIPKPNAALRGLGQVNRDLVAFVQKERPQRRATLDQDATLAETHKRDALFSYQHFKAYQPFQTYWAEQGLLVHSEFRDGNVPAGYQQLRVLQEVLEVLPPGVEQVFLRSDTAGYQHDLLQYCAEGKNQRFEVIGFAVGVDVTPEFKRAVAAVPEEEWHSLERVLDGGERVPTGQEWAEVCFVPEWVSRGKLRPVYRFLAIREPLKQEPLPGMEGQLPFPTVALAQGGHYKLFGVVTNRTLAGDALIWWYRERCGKSEEVHKVLKEDLAGGKLPSGAFGENAAWWAITVLAFNLHVAMERLVLGAGWLGKRLKALRFQLIALPGRVVHHARGLLVRIACGHPSFDVLLVARRQILALAAGPSG